VKIIRKIEFINISKNPKSEHGIHNLNFYVKDKNIYALYGRDRASLATVLKLAVGLNNPDYGEVRLFGEKLQEKKSALLNRIGFLPEVPAFYGNLTVEDNLRLLETLRPKHKKDMTEEVIKQMGIVKVKSKKANSLDMEQRKRLGLAIALIHNPELLILNDPFSGFDFNGIKEISKLFQNLCSDYGKTILLSSYNLNEIENIADCIGYMKRGNLTQEFPFKERDEINRQYICVVAENISSIIPIMERELEIDQFHVVDDKMLKIYDLVRIVEKLTITFIKGELW
jgi:ABC-type multidrug transport system, ATPase component